MPLMKPFLKWTSLLLFASLSAFLIWFGWVYATVDNLLWFHAAAVPGTARDEIGPLYFALMNLIGGSSAGLGVLGLLVTFTLLRRGDPKAAVVLSIAYAIPFSMAAVTAEDLAKTGAPTSWHIMGILLAATTFGLLTHLWTCAGGSMINRNVVNAPA
jgi:hypothetical protein